METTPFRAARERGDSPPPAPPRREGGGDARDGSGRLRGWIEARVSGQRWWVRAPLLLLFALLLGRHLNDPTYTTIFDGVNLGFHEAGHAAFVWFGNRILTTAGGTIFEIGIPLVAGAYLLFKQRDPFGAAVCLSWLGTALVGVGIYESDARAQALPLVSPFGPVDVDSHDWTVMLLKFGRLSQDQEIGALFRNSGLLSMASSVLLGAWILRIMAAGQETANDREGAS